MLRLLPLLVLAPLLSVSAQAPGEGFLGKTTGSLPYLEYGQGTDRLGGAKMTFLDTGVVLRVVDSTIINYKVRLSANHYAYLPKSNFTRDPLLMPKPYYLATSWIAAGNDWYDSVAVSLDERLPYNSIQQIHPSRIVVDIFGATSNTNWITQRQSLKEIRNCYLEQVEDDVYRMTIELTHAQHWGYSIYYAGNKLVIRVKRQPQDLDLEKMTIAVDAGHGGSNMGTTGVSSKIREKDYTLLIAKELEKALLDAGARVFMTREKDTTLSMPERIEMLQREDPHCLIGVHLNSSVKDSIRGVSTYYKHIGFRPLSRFIQDRMVELDLVDFGNVGSFNFALNGPTDYPNCLVEVAFLSNTEDEKKVLDPDFRRAVARQIVKGIRDWLQWCRREGD